jgi:hypothetical protein
MKGLVIWLKGCRGRPEAKSQEGFMIDPETEYLMLRAKDEAVLAIRAAHPAAAAAHHGLAVRYSTKAAIVLANETGVSARNVSAVRPAPPDPEAMDEPVANVVPD